LNSVATGYCLRALTYFNYAEDARVIAAARALAQQLESIESRVAALWGWRALTGIPEIETATHTNRERIIEGTHAASFPSLHLSAV
jgi:hypothetical protein